MKQILFAISAVIIHQLSFATAIEWGGLESSAPDPYNYGNVTVYSTTVLHLDVSFFVGTGWDSPGSTKTYIAASPNNDRMGSVAQIETYVSGAWLSAEAGETVNADSMLGKSSYFFNETFGSAHPEYKRQDWPEQVVGEHQYLKFLIQDYDEVVDYINGKVPDATTYYYGWAEYVVDEDGTFKILNSAIDFDGGPMIVGAIPEPTSGFLLLLGVAGLALRRQRMTPRWTGVRRGAAGTLRRMFSRTLPREARVLASNGEAESFPLRGLAAHLNAADYNVGIAATADLRAVRFS